MKHNFGLKILRNTQVSPSLRIPQGVQVLLLGLFGKSRTSIRSLRLSHPSIPVLALALVLLGPAFFSHSAYAAFSASISRTSSEAVTLSDGGGSGAIKPSYTGTLGTGSDVVTISSNCSAGYNLYVSAISGGSTNLSISDGTDYIPSATTATGSEAALSKDTWSIGKDGVTFSKLPAYTTDIGSLAPLYTNTGNEGSNGNDGDSSGRDSGNSNSNSQDYTIYYGVNVSTSKTPGTYTGDVLYTVLMNSACLEYTLKFDDNGATTSNLPNGTSGNEYPTIKFGQAVDLSEYSTTEKISKTGYHLSGWQDQDGNSYGITGTVDINPNDKSTVTLTAMWEANTYTIKYNAGSTGGTCTATDTPATYDQNVTLSSTKCAKTNYEQKGWSTTNSATNTKTYGLGQTLIKPNLTATNGGVVTLYPYFESTTLYFQTTKCSSLTAGQTTTLTDARDGQEYSVYRIPTNNQATNVAGKCIMTKDLNLGAIASVAGSSSTIVANGTMSINPADSEFTTPSGSGETITIPTSNVSITTSFSTANDYSSRYYRADGTGNYAGRGYYSWGAAMVVCPKKWRLPTKDELNNNTNWNSSTTGISYAANNSLTTIKAAPWSYSSGGVYLVDYGGFGWAPQYGDTWSSTQLDTKSSYRLTLDSSNGIHLHTAGKHLGAAVRCIAD